MNADSADTRLPHLDLADLIAEAAGQPIDDQARSHLAGCEECQLEANRWNLVADGVRGLAAAAPEAAAPAAPPTAAPAAPAARPRRSVLPRRTGRRVMLVAGSVAAALVLLAGVGVGTGFVHVRLSGSGTGTTLTAVTGCAQLAQAAGTLERVTSSGVVIKTASGQLVTVTTKATTKLTASGALLGDLKDGTPVTVEGPTSGGAIAADLVLGGAGASLTALPGLVVAQGTVADAGASGFTVVTPAGIRVPVTTSGGTAVAVLHATLAQLQVGAATMTVGYPGPHGTLSALAVAQPPSWPVGAHVSTSMRNCSPASINHEIMALAGV
jgi:hypothetical protein